MHVYIDLMNEGMDIINIIAFLLTAIGTYISWHEAKKSKTNAQIAEEARIATIEAAANAKRSILDRKQIGDFEQILRNGHDLEMKLAAWESTKATNAGRNTQKDHAAINEFISLINVHKHNISQKNEYRFEKSQEAIVEKLKSFYDGNSMIKDVACDIHEGVRTILEIVSIEKQDREFK